MPGAPAPLGGPPATAASDGTVRDADRTAPQRAALEPATFGTSAERPALRASGVDHADERAARRPAAQRAPDRSSAVVGSDERAACRAAPERATERASSGRGTHERPADRPATQRATVEPAAVGPPPSAPAERAAFGSRRAGDQPDAPTSPAPAPVAPSLPRPSLPPPTLPGSDARMVIRVTPEPSVAPPAGVSPRHPGGDTGAGCTAAPARSLLRAFSPRRPSRRQCNPPPCGLAPRRNPAAAPPTKRLRPGDLICGACGEGNEPVRKFCSRCGQSLSTATIAATPWYRRLIPHRKAKVLAAGERPKRRRGSGINFGAIVRWGRNVVLVVVLLGGVAYGAIPGFRDTVNGKVNSVIQNFTAKTGTPTPVHASSVTATSSTTGHAASLAVDAFSNTYWAASLSKDAHPKLTVGFSPAVNVDVILFISGNTANELSEPRPKELHIVFSNGATQNLLLADEATSQQFNINGASRSPA